MLKSGWQSQVAQLHRVPPSALGYQPAGWARARSRDVDLLESCGAHVAGVASGQVADGAGIRGAERQPWPGAPNPGVGEPTSSPTAPRKSSAG